MDISLLTRTVQGWESDGSLHEGEAIIVGSHEPPPLPGAVSIAEHPAVPDLWVVQVLGDDGSWTPVRRYKTEGEASEYVFQRLGELVSERYWGPEERGRQLQDVRTGAALRTAAMLLVPNSDLDLDRWDLVDRLRALGIAPDDRYWVEGVDGLPAPTELVWQLRRTSDGLWQVGVDERGRFHESGRFSVEAHACQWLLRRILTHEAVSMGMGGQAPFVQPRYRRAVRTALEETLELVANDPDDA